MKRVLSVLLCVALCLSCALGGVLAEDTANPNEYTVSFEQRDGTTYDIYICHTAGLATDPVGFMKLVVHSRYQQSISISGNAASGLTAVAGSGGVIVLNRYDANNPMYLALNKKTLIATLTLSVNDVLTYDASDVQNSITNPGYNDVAALTVELKPFTAIPDLPSAPVVYTIGNGTLTIPLNSVLDGATYQVYSDASGKEPVAATVTLSGQSLTLTYTGAVPIAAGTLYVTAETVGKGESIPMPVTVWVCNSAGGELSALIPPALPQSTGMILEAQYTAEGKLLSVAARTGVAAGAVFTVALVKGAGQYRLFFLNSSYAPQGAALSCSLR